VRILADKGICLVGKTRIQTLLAERVWVAIQSAIQDERSRTVDPTQLLAWFRQAYNSIIAKKGEPVGSTIPIKELFREVAAMVKQQKLPIVPQPQSRAAYSDEYFKRDLSNLVASGNLLAPDGMKLNLLPTSFAKTGLPIFYGDGVKIVGRVSFSAS
jgi:hypothetical protein